VKPPETTQPNWFCEGAAK